MLPQAKPRESLLSPVGDHHLVCRGRFHFERTSGAEHSAGESDETGTGHHLERLRDRRNL